MLWPATNQPSNNSFTSQERAQGEGAPEGVHLAGGEKHGSPSNPRAVLQQAHHDAALVVLTTKEHGEHLDFPLLNACTKPSQGTIKGQVGKTREEKIVCDSPRRGAVANRSTAVMIASMHSCA
jgi:hypothetical protein